MDIDYIFQRITWISSCYTIKYTGWCYIDHGGIISITVVLYRSRWCYIDCGGVISITVVLYRSRCCYIDHGGVISTTVVLYRSRWCYIDLLISISIPIEAIGTILWKPGFRKGGDPVTNLDLESQSPHLIFAVHPVFKRKKMAGNAPGKKYEYRPNSSARGEDLKTRSVSNN